MATNDGNSTDEKEDEMGRNGGNSTSLKSFPLSDDAEVDFLLHII